MWLNTIALDNNDINVNNKNFLEEIIILQDKQIFYLKIYIYILFFWNIYTILYYQNKN
jgi:hypothetical protein